MTTLQNALSSVLVLLRDLRELDISNQQYSGLIADLSLEFFIVISELKELVQKNEELQRRAAGLMENSK